MATFKGASDVTSDIAYYKPEKPKEEEPEPTCPSDTKYNSTSKKCECIDKTKTYDEKEKKCV